MRFAVVAVLALVSACVDPNLVPCGGQLCPRGSTCLADRCASPEQLAACDAQPDNTACSVRGTVGYCETGVCVASGCGNGVIDPGEACDDGNASSGDGCRADCRKVEMCGDGIVDQGEPCDDGNANPVDRCDACAANTWHATALVGGKIDPKTVGLTSVAGIAVDRYGNYYITDAATDRIRRIDATGILTVIAGTGARGFSGDGGPATSARLAAPTGIAVDGLGNIYFSDTLNSRVRVIDSNGVITTIAGSDPGFNGDGGPATSAQLFHPVGVAVDGLGNVTIADTDNQRIRRVDTTGTITTIAGDGNAGYAGDLGPATAAELGYARGVDVDEAGNVFIADTANQRIRRIDLAGTITTVAGTGNSGFSGDGGPATAATFRFPFDVKHDGASNLYIADRESNRVREIDATTGNISTIAGTGTFGSAGDGGLAVAAELAYPAGVAIDTAGTVYIADDDNFRVRKVSGGSIDTVVGNKTLLSGDGAAATTAALSSPRAVAIDAAGNVYIADDTDNRVRRVDPAGVITTIAGTGELGFGGDNGPAIAAKFLHPSGVAVDIAGNVYLADRYNHRIRRIDTSGTVTTVAGSGNGGSYGGDGGPATSARLSYPQAVAVDALGQLYVADTNNFRVRKVDTNGAITTIAGGNGFGLSGDGGPAISAQLGVIAGIAIDAAGVLYLADSQFNVVRAIGTNGTITRFAGGGSPGGDGGPATAAALTQPSGVVVAGSDVYIADTYANRVCRVDAAGVITTVIGVAGTPGDIGDGGPAAMALLTTPYAIAVGANGRLVIADLGNQRVRTLSATGILTTLAGRVEPDGIGPLAASRLADPRAVVPAGSFTLVAAGTSGTIEAVLATELTAFAGRYEMTAPTGQLARFRDHTFGTVGGVAYDAIRGLIYLTESTSNRLHVVTIVDPADANTWTIAPFANAAGTAGFADGAAATALFRSPTGLYLDPAIDTLFVADTGNHVIRAIDLAHSTVSTVAGTPATIGYFGDGGSATSALLASPEAVTRCGNGDLFVADTGNHRVRRVAATTGTITTVLGEGVAASSGEGHPAMTFPVNAPRGLACDAIGNLFVTSMTTVRLLPADASNIVDGTGEVETIYGASPAKTFPASVTHCLTGLAIVDATTIEVTDSCAGILVELDREH